MKKSFVVFTLACLFCVPSLVCGLELPQSDFLAWRYDMDVQPNNQDLDENGVEDWYDGGVPTISGGVAIGGTEGQYYRTDFGGSIWRANVTGGAFTVEFRVQVLATGTEGTAGTLGCYARNPVTGGGPYLNIARTGQTLSTTSGVIDLGSQDNTDGQHVFRIAREENGSVWIWRDGELLNPNGTSLVGDLAVFNSDILQIGDIWSTGHSGDYELDYIALDAEAYMPVTSAVLSQTVFEDDFEAYDITNPADFAVGGQTTGNWTGDPAAADASRIFQTGNFGGTKLWISNVDGSELISKALPAEPAMKYRFSAALLTESSVGAKLLDASYDIRLGESLDTSVSVIDGPMQIITQGDDAEVPDSKTDHIFEHEFTTLVTLPEESLFLVIKRIGINQQGGWFGVDDVVLEKFPSIYITETNESTQVKEGGAADRYEISLAFAPVSDVVVTATPDPQLDLGNGAGEPVLMTFTATGPLTQSVSVQAVDDELSEGPQQVKISHGVASADEAFVALRSVDVVVDDDERYCGDEYTVFLAGDLNKDCYITVEDMAIFAEGWLECTDPIELHCIENIPVEPLKQTDVFSSGQDGINTYRIPSVITAPDGTLLAFCEARKFSSRDKSPSMMVVKRSFDDGRSWGPMEILHDPGQEAAMDPMPVVDESTGRLWLLYELWPEGWDSNPQPGLTTPPSTSIWAQYTDDSGETWSGPADITEQVKKPEWDYYANGPGRAIQTVGGSHPGRMIVACSHRGGTDGTQHFYYSDDHGQSWQLADSYLNTGAESQMVELIDGTLLWNIRGGGAAGRRISYSYDDGQTWTAVTNDPALIEPGGCQASLLRYTRTDQGYSKNRILFSNPASTSSRVNMTVKMSYDECDTWPVSKQIYGGSSAYSCLTILNDGSIGLLYEADNYSRIRFARFTLRWLTDGEDWLGK